MLHVLHVLHCKTIPNADAVFDVMTDPAHLTATHKDTECSQKVTSESRMILNAKDPCVVMTFQRLSDEYAGLLMHSR